MKDLKTTLATILFGSMMSYAGINLFLYVGTSMKLAADEAVLGKHNLISYVKECAERSDREPYNLGYWLTIGQERACEDYLNK